MTTPQNNETADIRHFLGILKGRKWSVALVALVTVASALFFSYQQTPVYSASSRVLVKSPVLTPGQYVAPPNLATEAEIASSDAVASLAADRVSGSVPLETLLANVRVEPVVETEVLVITYSATDPSSAQRGANAFAETYLTYRQTQAEETLEAAQRRYEDRIRELRNRIDILDKRIRSEEKSGGNTSELETQRSIILAQIGDISERLEDVRPGQGASSDVGEIIAPAEVPESPSSPNHLRNAAFGLIFGLALGILVAFLRDRLDDRFRGRPDVERAIESPVLATVPKFDIPKQGEIPLPVAADPKGPASEAYRNLRTGLQFISAQKEIKSVLVTSPQAHEGKTSTTANLGIAMSITGRRVILVSADLRRPTLETALGAESSVGLSSFLLGEVDDPTQLILGHPELPNLSLITAGAIPSNPAELLTSPRLVQLLEWLEGAFDFVLFDSPPVLPVADAVILASHVDGVVLIFNAAKTSRSSAVHAKEQIERVGGQVLGVVLNAFDPVSTPYYYEPYSYSTYYDSEPSSDGSRAKSSASPSNLREIFSQTSDRL